MEKTGHVEKYWTSLERFLEVYEKRGRRDRFRAGTIDEYESWAAGVRKTLEGLLGLGLMEACDPAPALLESARVGTDITREKILLQVEPGVYMPVYVLVPDSCAGNKNARSCICLPGHLGGGKYSVAGCADIPAVADKIGEFGYDYGLAIAGMGIVALCPDCRGFGERRERSRQGDSPDLFLNGSCRELAHMAEPLGLTVAGLLAWDAMRLVDYVLARGEWDPSRIACAGFSGGGMQALWLSALDARVERALVSGYLYGYRDSLTELNGNCSCNYVPNLFLHVDSGDIGALVAPRPFLIQSCANDHLNGKRGMANVIPQVEVIRSAYRLFGKESSVRHDVRPGGHHFDKDCLADFFAL